MNGTRPFRVAVLSLGHLGPLAFSRAFVACFSLASLGSLSHSPTIDAKTKVYGLLSLANSPFIDLGRDQNLNRKYGTLGAHRAHKTPKTRPSFLGAEDCYR